MSNNIKDPYWANKDNIDFNYVLKVNMPITLKANNDIDNNIHLEDIQEESAYENIEKGIKELLQDTIYTKESFEDLGENVTIYPGLNYVGDDIEMYFGIVGDNINIKDLIDDIKEYMYVLDSNSDYDSSVCGWNDGENEVDSAYVHFSGSDRDKIKVEIIKQPNINEEYDKLIVNENTLTFKKENDIHTISLTDDGIIEHYLNEKLVNTIPFSKLGIIRECKQIVQEGFNLIKEVTVQGTDTEVDTEQSKQDLEQGIADVDELQQLKDELVNKVDKLVNESTVIEENLETEEFPSTEFTQKSLTKKDIIEMELNKELSIEQVAWITTHFNSIETFEKYFKEFVNLLDISDNTEFISIDEYIKNLINEGGIN